MGKVSLKGLVKDDRIKGLVKDDRIEELLHEIPEEINAIKVKKI